MASRIKGITVEIDGDATGLDKALKDVNSSISKTQSSLNDVTRLLKLDPSNTVLVAQKQDLLKQAISQTSDKLKALEQAQSQVYASFQKGDIGKEKYQAFQREVEATRSKLEKYKGDLTSLEAEQTTLATNTARLQKFFNTTGTSVDDFANTLGSKLTNSIRQGSASSADLYSALTKISKAVSSGKADINTFCSALDTVDDGQALKNLMADFDKVGATATHTRENIESVAASTKGEALMGAADTLSGLGDKITSVGTSAITAFGDVQSATSKVSAYFGETGTAAETTANVIKNVYGAGVGESFDSVADALIMVKKNLGDLSEADLTNITQQAITLDEKFGIDMNETLRGVNSLMTQYGMSAQEAFDYIVVGTQNGLDKTNELGDNLSEYAGKFAQAGYSASDYFQLLNNGLEGGAYNLDKVNDAINEVTTRLVDGTVGDAIDSYSTKTQELFSAWQNGEATQKDVIDSIVADIAGCTNQQEALNMAATAFGTMAEDGSLKFISALTSVGDAYTNVGGAAENMYSQSLTPMQEMEANTRTFQQALAPLGEKLAEIANTILPPLTQAISAIASWFSLLPEPVQNFVVILGALIAVFTALTPVIAALAVSITALDVSLLPIIAVIAGIALAITGIILVIQNWGAICQWFSDLWNTICTGIGIAIEGVKTFFTDLATHAQNVWTTITNAVQFAIELIGAIINAAITIITLPFQMIWENCKGIVETVWSAISGVVSAYIQNVLLVIQTIMTAISGVISSIWDGIKERIDLTLQIISVVVTTVFNAIRSTAESVWSAIKGVIEGVVNAIRSVVESVFNAVAGFVTSVFEGVKNTVTNIWEGIKNAIVSPIEQAKNTLKGIIDSIMSIFGGLHFELPHIKLPHFSIQGEFSLTPPSVPHLAVDWYKQGGIMTKPTVFGMNGSALMAGGEAGAEAILPLKSFYTKLESMLDANANSSNPLVESYLKTIAANSDKNIYLSTGELVGALSGGINQKLGAMKLKSERLMV